MPSDVYSKNDMKNFLKECMRMKCFKHPNILGLLGMCLNAPDKLPRMVLPFMINGNLKRYLQMSRGYSEINAYPLVSI